MQLLIKHVFVLLALWMSAPAVSWSADGMVVVDSGRSTIVNATSPGAVVLDRFPDSSYAEALDQCRW
jgi:hypothetical protein